MKTFFCEKEIKLSRFLLEKYEGELSFSTLNKLLRKKDIKINGQRVCADKELSVGDTVVVYYDGATVKADYKTLFEDENVIVAIKPKGITSENFFKLLKDRFMELYFCHRLDRNTDGIMIFAKNEEAATELKEGFLRRTFLKNYYALVNGIFEKKSGDLTAYLQKDPERSIVKIFDDSQKNTKKIVTAYNVVSEDAAKNISLLNVRLITGRTHQIRAHLAHEGHFVLGDDKYGDRRVSERLGIKNLALTAFSMELKFGKCEKLNYLDGRKFVYKTDIIKSI